MVRYHYFRKNEWVRCSREEVPPSWIRITSVETLVHESFSGPDHTDQISGPE